MKSDRKSVLIIIPHLGVGGTEMQTLNIVKALKGACHDVTVLCLYRNIPPMVKAYEDAGARVSIISPQYDNYDVKIDYPSGIRSVTFLYKILKKALKEVNPDVIHVQYMTPGATIILILKYLLGFDKIVATSHTASDIYSPTGLRLLKFINKHCLKGFQCITERAERGYFGSSEILSIKTEIGPGAHFTIHNSLPETIHILDKPKKFSPDMPITIGVVSRLEKIKGMELVVPAFKRLVVRNLDVRLLVVGEGSLRKFMETQAKEMGVTDKVEFVGRKDQSALQEWYDKIDILLMPSRSEGFGLTAIEGMARGCVPVVANVGGLPEVVSEGSGLLHNVDDITDMVDKIQNASKRLETLSKGAVERSRAFSQDKFSEQIGNFYNSLWV